MGRLTIYREAAVGNPTVVAVCTEVEYHGGWMEEEYVTVKVQSPTPIAFAIDDYVTYRGQRYSISYDPQKLKKASSGSHGEGFTYDGLKLYSDGSRMKDVAMKDVVLNDNQLSYTSLGKFSFYCQSVEDLADRIQANLNRNSNEWRVLTPNWNRTNVRLEYTMQSSSEREALWEEYYDGSESAGKTEINISIDDNSCWDALKCAYNDFGLSYRIVGKTVIIGGMPVDAGHVFMYGKNKGLREISDSGTDDQRIVTKLFAYGSENNLPLNYYGNTLVICNAPILQKTQSDLSGGTSFYHYIVDVKYDRNLFTRSIGTDNYQLTLKKESGDGAHTSRLVFAGKPSSAVWSDEVMQQYRGKVEITVPTDSIVPEKYIGGYFEIVGGLNKNLWPQTLCNKTDANYPGALSVNRLMLPGFPQQSVKDYFTTTSNWSKYHEKDFYPHLLEIVSRIHQEYGTLQWGNIYLSEDAYDPYITSGKCLTIGAREGTVNFDGNGNTQEILPSIAGGTDNVVLVGSSIEDNGYVQEADDFDIWIKDAAIAWDELYGAAIETVVLSMTSGYCTGRDFEVSGVERTEKNGVSCWKFTLKRSPDSSMNRLFPYADSGISGYCQIAANDTFVVTGIELPDEYVEEASVRLFIAAVDALDELSEPKRSYSPKIDQIFMQRDLDENGQSAMYYKLYPGIGLSIRDTDLAIDKTVYIDTLTINEFGDAEIATYDVTLRDEKELGLMEQIQVSVGGGVQTRGGSATAASEAQTASESARSKSADRLSGNEAHNAWGQTYWENGKPKDVDGDMTVHGGISFGETGKGISEDGDATLGDVGADKVTVSETVEGETIETIIEPDKVTTPEIETPIIGTHIFDGALIGGSGWRIWLEEGGASHMVIDQLEVRLKAYFAELEIRRLSYSGGNLVFSAAASKIEEVIPVDAGGNPLSSDNPNFDSLLFGYKCYFVSDDGTTATVNDWRVGDQARCQTFNIDSGKHTGVSNRYYWRKVLEAESDNGATSDEGKKRNWVVLAAKVFFGTRYNKGMQTGVTNDIPQAGDTIVQLGNQNTATFGDRQNAITLETNSTTAPAIYKYQGIDDFSLDGKMVQADFYDSGTKKYKSVTYGDWFVGANTKISNNQRVPVSDPFNDTPETFVRYRQDVGGSPLLEIKAKIDASSTVGGTEINQYVSPATQNLIDGKNAVYTITQTAMSQSTGPDYKAGDIWILPNAVGGYPAGTILVAISDRTNEQNVNEHNINKWAKKDSYTDDAAFNSYISRLKNGSIISGTPTDAQAITNILNVLKGSLESQTTIEGGLVLTSLIAMRNNNNAVTAGICGDNDDNNIAAWFGGSMVDHEASPLVANFAKSLFRFDGSGYLAGGNISWNVGGDTTVQGTIMADNFFHALCYYRERGIYIGEHVLYYYTYDQSHDEDIYGRFANGHAYTEEEIVELSGGYTVEQLVGFTATTGTSDVVMCMPSSSNNWEPEQGYLAFVTLPNPDDFPGKVVEISGYSYGTAAKQFEVHCYGGDRMTGLVYADGNGDITCSQPTYKATISTGGVARFISARLSHDTYGSYYVWALLANQTGGDVIINGGGGTGSGTVTSVGLIVPQGFNVTGSPITGAGSFTIGFANGYALPTTADVNKGVTAYGWGNHALAGYLTIQDAQNTYSLNTHDHDGTYLRLSGADVMAGNLKLGAGTAVKANDKDTDLLAYKSSTWGGVTGEHWFVGAAGVNGFIRSASPLKRWANSSDQYTIWDSSNLTPANFLTKAVADGYYPSLSDFETLENEVVSNVGFNNDTNRVTAEWLNWGQSSVTPPLKRLYRDQQSGISQGWHEVARVVNYGSFLFSVGGGWSNRASTLATFYVTHHHEVNRLTQIGTSYLGYITKVRLRDIHEELGSNGGCIAVDVYVNYTTTSIVCAEVIPLDSRPTVTMSTFANVAETPSTTVWEKTVENRENGDYLPLGGGTVSGILNVKPQLNILNSDGETKISLFGSSGNIHAANVYIGGTATGNLAATRTWVGQQGYQANVIETVKVYGTALSVSNKAVDIPLATSQVAGVVLVGESDGLKIDDSHLVIDTAWLTTQGYFKLASQAANKVLASPDNQQGVPTFRSLVVRDIPDLSSIYTTGSTLQTYFNTRIASWKIKDVEVEETQARIFNGKSVIYSAELGDDGLLTLYSTTLDIDVPTKVSDLTNDSGFITQSDGDGRYVPQSWKPALLSHYSAGGAVGISSNTDLNDFETSGTYYCQSAAVAGTLANCPYKDGNFRLFVLVNTGTEGRGNSWWGTQILVTGNGLNAIYTRGHSDRAWTTWRRVNPIIRNTLNNSAEVPLVENLCLPLSIGTGTGTGYATLDLSAYATTSAMNTALSGYLPLTAGADKPLTGQLYLDTGSTTEVYVNVKSNRATANGGGWAFPLITARNAAGTSVFSLGTYGAAAALNYAYIGAGAWNAANNLRVYSDGSISLGNSIKFQGTNAQKEMITFIDNVSGTDGNGIAIGGGGMTVIGGGESASTIVSGWLADTSHYGGNEVMYIGNDQTVSIFTNLNSGWANRKEFLFGANGSLTTPGGVTIKANNGTGLTIVDTSATHDFTAFWIAQTYNNVSREIFTMYSYETKYWDMCIGTHPNAVGYGGLYMYNSGDNALRWGIGTATPVAKLDVNGNVHISGTLTGVTNIDGMMVFDSTNNKVTVGTLDVTTLGMNSISVGDTGYKMSITSDDSGATFNGANDGDYIFMNGSTTRGNIYAGAGNFNGSVSAANVASSGDVTVGNGLRISFSNGYATFGSTSGGTLRQFTFNGPVVDSSDISLKNVSRYVEPNVRDIANAPVIEFSWKDDTSNEAQLGSIAQYWQKVFPQAVKTTQGGTLAMSYNAIALASAVTAARHSLDNERRIAELELRVVELESLLESYEISNNIINN